MIEAKAMQLVAALRSGEYKQGRRALQLTDGSACCLGVACLLAGVPKDVIDNEFHTHYAFGPDHDTAFLPKMVADEFGFASRAGEIGRGHPPLTHDGEKYRSLYEANDVGVPFTVIADYIEKNWAVL